jgi:hypothetical protein
MAALERQLAAPRRARSGTSVFASPHRIKGFRAALRYCEARGIAPDGIRGLSPEQVLQHFAEHERFVYLPIGPEWAGRMVVEARVLGCEVVVNDNVGVAGEAFWGGDRTAALDFLAGGPRRFWTLVEALLDEPAPPPIARKEPATGGSAHLLLAGLRQVPPWLMPFDAPLPPPRVFSPW